MPLLQSDYKAPRWLPGAHLQTIVPARFFPRPDVQYRREIVDMPDGDFIVFEGNHYRAGLLYRSFYINAIIVDGVKPSFTELEKFQESADGLQKEC